jgi:hypothetical protein
MAPGPAPAALVMPTQAAPHMARQWGPPASPIKAALITKEDIIK